MMKNVDEIPQWQVWLMILTFSILGTAASALLASLV